MENNRNRNNTEFSDKFKNFCQNRAVIVTFVTLMVATGIIVAITIAANRSKRPLPGGNSGITDTAASTHPDTSGPVIKDETLPTYNGGETRPVGGEPIEEPAKFALPVQGKLQKGHDTTIQVYSNTMGDYRVHLGLDIATPAEAPVMAAADGTVEKVWEDALMGTCLAITHADDTVTIYKNLQKDLPEGIAAGVTVKQGQTIGAVGDTAALEMADEPHLHFEMTVGGLPVNPLDYFSKSDVGTLSDDTAFESSAVESDTTAATRPNGK